MKRTGKGKKLQFTIYNLQFSPELKAIFSFLSAVGKPLFYLLLSFVYLWLFIVSLVKKIHLTKFNLPKKHPPSRRAKTILLYPQRKPLININLIAFLLGVFLSLNTYFLILDTIFKDLPSPQKLSKQEQILTTKIYDRNYQLLYKIFRGENRTPVKLADLPRPFIYATIAIEDKDFYRHRGLSPRGILRAAYLYLFKAKTTGGSTITQQLVKNTLLNSEKTLRRKIKEAILAILVEQKYSKDQILEMYLNQVGYGGAAYGIEEASQKYFGKHAKDLNMAEGALLAGLTASPTKFSPFGLHPEMAKERQAAVLRRMAEDGYITEEEEKKTKEQELKFAPQRDEIFAPHFVMYVKDYLEEKYGENFLKEKGLKVYTTLDWDLQEYAEKIVKDQAKINEKFHAYNAALIIISPKDGHILAMVGSKDFFASSYPENCRPGKDCLFEPYFNVAAPPGNMGRQPGSAFKPFAYATAFKKGYTPNTLVWDVRTNFGTWGGQEYIPKNYDNKFRGLVSFRQGLAQSLNIPSVKVLYLAGIEDTIKTARDLGITTLTQDLSEFGLSLVLGGKEVKLIDLASSYGVFANDGVKISPSAILKIEDVDGNIIEENQKSPQRVLDAQTARLINSVLSDYEIKKPVFGSHSSVFFDEYKVAAKTGTTQYYNNFWLMGYTPETVVGVWVGNNNNSDMDHIHGTQLTGPIFHQVMEKCLSVYPPKEAFQSPAPVISQNPILDGQSLSAHSILYYVQRDNPNQKPDQPWMDPQYLNWETGVEEYLTATNTPKTNLPSDLPLE